MWNSEKKRKKGRKYPLSMGSAQEEVEKMM
jgi:hypothetical protein